MEVELTELPSKWYAGFASTRIIRLCCLNRGLSDFSFSQNNSPQADFSSILFKHCGIQREQLLYDFGPFGKLYGFLTASVGFHFWSQHEPCAASLNFTMIRQLPQWYAKTIYRKSGSWGGIVGLLVSITAQATSPQLSLGRPDRRACSGHSFARCRGLRAPSLWFERGSRISFGNEAIKGSVCCYLLVYTTLG